MMAILDVSTGHVYDPPLSGSDPQYRVSMDPTSKMDVGFRIDSTLLILRNACRKDTEDCGTYYFNWKADHFEMLTWTPANLAEDRGVLAGGGTVDSFSHLARFEEFPVKNILKGRPVPPILARPEERRFRTVIRQGVSKGWNVEHGQTGNEAPEPGPNFAGHYVIIKWGCGSDCGEMAIVDAETGRVYQPPFAGSGHSYFWYPTRFSMPPQFRVDSNLFIMPNICADNVPVCGTYYFIWQENQWRKVHWEPLPPGVMQPLY
jgi:hypothetical protein